jgi:hypothetical protein
VSIRGTGWYVTAFVTLIVAATFIGVAAASFFASLTPLYVSIVCSVAAVVFGIVAAVRARPAGAGGAVDAPPPADAAEPTDAAEPADAGEPADAAPSSDTE